MPLKLKRPLAFIDIEATGMNVPKDHIVEIAVLKVWPSGEKSTYSWLLNPGKKMSDEIIAIHGITNEAVEGKPLFKEIAKELFDVLNDCDLAGYNAGRLDLPILVEEFMRCDIVFDLRRRKLVDVFRIFTLMEKRDLPAAYEFYCNKKLTDLHRAETDALATYEVFCAQLERYDNLEKDVEFLDEFTRDMDFVDTGRRMIYIKGEPHFNFGKHKGRKVTEVFAQEPQYYDWIMRGDFLLDTKQKVKEIRLMMKNAAR